MICLSAWQIREIGRALAWMLGIVLIAPFVVFGAALAILSLFL